MEILNKTSKKPRNLWISSIDAEEINDRIIYMKDFRRNKRSIWYMWEAQEIFLPHPAEYKFQRCSNICKISRLRISKELIQYKDRHDELKNITLHCDRGGVYNNSLGLTKETRQDIKTQLKTPIARQLTEQQQETVTAMIVVGSRPREILSTGLTNDAVQFNKFNVIVDHQSQGRGVRITKVRGTNDSR
ncbi:hypothetical protein RhiirA5_419220 [Rhizophagus irregularis]|uniref:Uncharacterized protein n=1 Tax=Rhizophagus irregularis TaxID=588596 RepID=A0A2I1F9U5_9GLOM|nr:hypothetical protein RhiirA5_419220 [Rhizophagus irregularis]PKC56930.1 hypothetical protein RhiirA1_473276 [Rhizophagus irregularis]PKY31146.1 hypothetical protein RhiirB3_448616 [Rhizophagus irregularis]